MRQAFLIIAAIFSYTIAVGQKDPKAKEILDKVSENTQSYQTIKIKFDYILENTQAGETDTFPGTIFIKGEKYKLFLMNNEIFFDGKKQATFMLEEMEVTISEPDTSGKSDMNPADLLTIYQQDFKYRLMGEEKKDKTAVYLIELIPEKRDDKKYAKIKLWIDKSHYKVHSMKSLGKDGIHYILNINEFKPDIKITDSLFSFDPKAHPNVEIIDLR